MKYHSHTYRRAFATIAYFVAANFTAFGGLIYTNLFSFSQTNGYDPRPRVVLDTNGVIYGTTAAGGRYDQGTAFRLTPDGTLTTLLVFDGTNGRSPYGGIIQAK